MNRQISKLAMFLVCCQIGGCALRGAFIGGNAAGGAGGGGVNAPWFAFPLPAIPDFGTPLVQAGGVRGATAAAGGGGHWTPIPVSQDSISLAGLPGR